MMNFLKLGLPQSKVARVKNLQTTCCCSRYSYANLHCCCYCHCHGDATTLLRHTGSRAWRGKHLSFPRAPFSVFWPKSENFLAAFSISTYCTASRFRLAMESTPGNMGGKKKQRLCSKGVLFELFILPPSWLATIYFSESSNTCFMYSVEDFWLQ